MAIPTLTHVVVVLGNGHVAGTPGATEALIANTSSSSPEAWEYGMFRSTDLVWVDGSKRATTEVPTAPVSAEQYYPAGDAAWIESTVAGGPVGGVEPNGSSWGNASANSWSFSTQMMRRLQPVFPHGLLLVKMGWTGGSLNATGQRWLPSHAELWSKFTRTIDDIHDWALANRRCLEFKLLVWVDGEESVGTTGAATYVADEAAFIAAARAYLNTRQDLDGTQIPVVSMPIIRHQNSSMAAADIDVINVAKSINAASQQNWVMGAGTSFPLDPEGVVFNQDYATFSFNGANHYGDLVGDAIERVPSEPWLSLAGGSTNDSYSTLEATEQALARYGASAAWKAATPLEKIQAKNNAARYLDAVYGPMWKGNQSTVTQLRSWPRKGVIAHGYCLSTTEIPVALREAEALAANAFIQGVKLFPDPAASSANAAGAIEQEDFKIGPIEFSTKYSDASSFSSSVGGLPLLADVDGILEGADLLRSGITLSRS